MKKSIKKYYPGVTELMTPRMASVKTADVPLVSGTPKQVSVSEQPGFSFKDKAGAYMSKAFSNPDIGGMASQLGGNIAMMINANKKQDPTGKPYKKGTNMIKYGPGTKSLTKEEGKVGKGSEYFAQAKTLNAQEKAAFRKLDAEAKQKGMTFEYKGLKYDPTNPANLTTPSRSSNVGITYSSGAPSQSTAQTTTSQAPAQGLVTDTATTQQAPARTARKLAGKVDAKTGYSIYPNNRVYNPKTQVMGKLDAKGNISWDNGQKEAIAPATATATAKAPVTPVAKDSTGKALIKKTEVPKEGELTDEDRALNADLISLGLDFGSILSPEPISAGGMAVGSQIAVNKARRLRGESAGFATHALETVGTALSAVPLVGDYAKANTALKTIGRILKSPSTRKALTMAGAAGVGLGGDQALNSMNEIYQKYEKEGLSALGKDDLRKAMEAARFVMNATQVGKGVSRTVKKSVTLPTAEQLMVPEKGIKFGVTNKGNATKQVVGGAKVNKQGELEYDMSKQGKRPADMTEVEGDLRRTRREQAGERNRAAAPKRQEEFSKEFEKKTGYKTREEMRQAEEAKAIKAREQRRADYKAEKAIQKEKQEAFQQDSERKLVKFSSDVNATKEAVKRSFLNKQAAKRFQEENTTPELIVMRKMGDKTPAPIKMTPSQRMLPEGPEQITSKESQEVINRINQRIRTSPNKTKAELASENETLRAQRESRQAPIVYKSDLPSGEVKGLLPESSELKAARIAAEKAAIKRAQRSEKRAAKKEADRIEKEKAAKNLARKEKAAATRKANEEKKIQEKIRRIKFYGTP
jgi:hypothetical protein